MAVAFNAATTTAGSGSTLNLPHTAAGQNRLLLFACAYFTALGSPLDSPTCAGVPMVQVGSVLSAGVIGMSVWRASAPPAGSAPVVFAWDATADFVAVACSYTGVHQVVPLGTPVNTAANSVSASATVPGTAGDSMVFAALGVNLTTTTATATPHGGQTERQNALAGVSPTRLRLAAADDLGGGDAELAWTLSQARLWVELAVEIKPAPASGIPVAGRSGGLAGLKRLGRTRGQG